MTVKRKRSASAAEIIGTKFKTAPFDGDWKKLIGDPQLCNSWIIWGESGNGKTSFCLDLAKYLTNFARVGYDAIEEGFNHTLKMALIRHDMAKCGSRFQIIDGESIDELRIRLSKPKSPDIMFIDSVQYTGLSKLQYMKLKREFPKKLFIWISHEKGKLPEGRLGEAIRYDAHVKIRIEGFRAFAKSRFQGEPNFFYTIWEQGAYEYWGLQTV